MSRALLVRIDGGGTIIINAYTNVGNPRGNTFEVLMALHNTQNIQILARFDN
jgi:hypothetical protein